MTFAILLLQIFRQGFYMGDIWKSAEENPDKWIAVFTAQHKEPVSAHQPGA